MNSYHLQINNLNHYYGQSHTLRDMAIEVPPACCTCLMGRNGVGKTTLAKCLMGLETGASGEILFDGIEFIKKPAETRAPAGIGYVPQGRQIFPLLTVEENIRTGFFATGKAPGRIPTLVYELFPVLHEMRNRRGGDLSGGQQQQLAIARALVADPKLLVLDEPAEGIQPSIVSEIAEVVRMLCQDMEMGVLIIEQKLPFIRKVADRFTIMDRGSVVANGAINDLTEDLVHRHLVV